MALPPFLSSIVGWLRAGYPEGVPENDYLPLFALLASQLSQDELEAIAAELTESSTPTSAQAIRTAIENVAQVAPLESDVANVRAHLAAGGWPLEPLRTQEARPA